MDKSKYQIEALERLPLSFTGELKLAQRQISMVELSAIIDSIDKNGDGKLTYDEVKAVLKQVGGKVI